MVVLKLLSGLPEFLSSIRNSLFPFMDKNKVVRKRRANGKYVRRPWEDRRTDKGTSFDPEVRKKVIDAPLTNDLLEKLRTRKYAALLSYNGKNYYGMQRNYELPTIEEEILSAMNKTKSILLAGYDYPQDIQFQRAARTDKGVSAARQVIALKMSEKYDLEKINAELPPVIKIWAVERVTGKFDAKRMCSARTYTYLMPTVAFMRDGEEMIQNGYRAPEETLSQVSHILGRYVGLHNFHNFTAKKFYNDPSAKRLIYFFECGKPFVNDDVEFVVLKVKGQSFMMHQIRKMVGLVVAIVRGITAESIMEKTFDKDKVNIPRVPGLGLLLDFVHYDYYNNRYGKDGIHRPLEWKETEEAVNEFRNTHLYPAILNTEIKNQEMVTWILEKLSKHSFDDVEESKKYESIDIDDGKVAIAN